jgi:hypothetical protein
MAECHVEYVGPPELHDGHLLHVSRAGDRATVVVRSPHGREIALEFTGVSALSAARPEGMLLSGLAELRTASPAAGRQFVFANWEEWDDAGLEITARDFHILPPGPSDVPPEERRDAPR